MVYWKLFVGIPKIDECRLMQTGFLSAFENIMYKKINFVVKVKKYILKPLQKNNQADSDYKK